MKKSRYSKKTNKIKQENLGNWIIALVVERQNANTTDGHLMFYVLFFLINLIFLIPMPTYKVASKTQKYLMKSFSKY